MTTVVETRALEKRYGRLVALRGVDLTVEGGAVVGLLGPNGAGKTTLAEILEGLRPPSGGWVRVFGMDPRRHPRELRERIGVQLQETALPRTLRVREVLRLFAAFYRDPAPVDEILSVVGLEPKADAFTRDLSGGQKQRLALGMALINRPELLILDEPTTGLDPAARRRLHELVRRLGAEGRTILLTTHYVEEAENLCDRVLMLRAGEIVADGTPFELVGRAEGASRLWVAVDGTLDPAPLEAAGVAHDGQEAGYHMFTASDASRAVVELGNALRKQGLDLVDLRVKRPTLEDVYLELMGRLEEGAPPVRTAREETEAAG